MPSISFHLDDRAAELLRAIADAERVPVSTLVRTLVEAGMAGEPAPDTVVRPVIWAQDLLLAFGRTPVEACDVRGSIPAECWHGQSAYLLLPWAAERPGCAFEAVKGSDGIQRFRARHDPWETHLTRDPRHRGIEL